MILDKFTMFDEAVAITVTRNSTNVLDLIKASQDIGLGEPLYVFITVTTAFVTGDAAVLQAALVSSAATNLGTPTTHRDQPAVIAAATLVAGYTLLMRVDPVAAMLRYLGIIYTVTVGSFSAGAVTAGIVHDVQKNTSFAKNYVTA